MEGFRRAAQSGNIDALYALIQEDADVLRRIDQMEFVDTPLHMAAAAGHTDFAMEMLNLKPSFARKLNQRGLSPIHLALQNNKEDVVTQLLLIDKDLVRVKGREGYTPTHIVARDENVPFLSLFLEQCPDCISDLTIRRETALHIAARNEKLEAFRAILQRIEMNLKDNPFQETILNSKDKEGNTVLHIAASKNHTQMIELLIGCKEVDRNVINAGGLKALDVSLLQTQVDEEIVNLLRSAEDHSHSRFFEASRLRKKLLIKDRTEMKIESMNALLVVFALILTITYQALLSPPSGVFQSDASSNSTTNNNQNAGKSVLSPFAFLWFFIPNGIAFSIAWFITIYLVSIVAKSMEWYLNLLNFLMSFCYGAAVTSIAPKGIITIVVVGYLPLIIVLLIDYVPLFRFKKH